MYCYLPIRNRSKVTVSSRPHILYHLCSTLSTDLQESRRLLKDTRVVLYLVHDVLDLHPLSEEVHELPLRVNQVQDDAVVHQVVLVVLLVLIGLGAREERY